LVFFDMEHNKATGPDGFPAEFYQFFWEVVKTDLMNLFYEFYARRLSIHSLNFGVHYYQRRIQQDMPIFLLNVNFKIFTKMLNSRTFKVADKLIGPSQTAFIPGRYIMDCDAT
jgi:hypothetical protein